MRPGMPDVAHKGRSFQKPKSFHIHQGSETLCLQQPSGADTRSVGSLAMTSRGLTLYVFFSISAQCVVPQYIIEIQQKCSVE
jgi:hypothetical protein